MLENPLQTLQRFFTLAEQVRQIQEELKEIKALVRESTQALDTRLRAAEVEIGVLKEARATIRETVRAEITTAVADLLVCYERERRQEKPELPSGE